MMGRPPIDIDKKVFETLCSVQCTEEEIACHFGVSADTIYRWCKKNYKTTFAEAIKRFTGTGKISLRRWQWKKASEGSVPMLIWLGKQYLKQTDNVQLSTDTKKDFEGSLMEHLFKNAQLSAGKLKVVQVEPSSN